MQTEQIEVKPKKTWTVEKFVKAFVKGELGKKWKESNYESGFGHTSLRYRAHGDLGGRWDERNNREFREGVDQLAVRLPDGTVFSNANRLNWCGTSMAWGNRARPWGQVPAQRWLEEAGAIPVPFSVFETAKLNITDAVIIERAPSETVRLKLPDHHWNPETQASGGFQHRHYTGACLLRIGETYFLFDIDRGEIPHGIFNPFVVKLTKPATSIAEAYEGLVPDKVKEAKAMDKEVLRQGEWFFIKRFDVLPSDRPAPTQEQIEAAMRAPHVLRYGGAPTGNYRAGMTYNFEMEGDHSDYLMAVEKWEKANDALTSFNPKRGELKHGSARPNTAEQYIQYAGMVLVSGKISHSGREHHDITLKGWWEAVPNTAVESWQVTGDID